MGGGNCLGTTTVAQVAIATGLLKQVENILHEARVGLVQLNHDVRHASQKVDKHKNYVHKKSLDSVQVAEKMVSFMGEKKAAYATLVVLLATAENGFSAAFYTMGYCHQKVVAPFL